MNADRIWQIAGWTMLHYFWVGAALGLLTLVVRLLLRATSPNVRYLWMLGCLSLMTISPAVIAVIVDRESPPPVFPAPPAPVREELPIAIEEANAPALIPIASEPATQSPITVIQSEPEPTPFISRLIARLARVSAKVARYLPWLWIIGMPLVFLLTSVGLIGAERLRRHSRPLQDAGIAELCQKLAARLKLTCRVAVAVCDRIASPILVGIVHPVILLPAVALAGWDPQQLEMVLLHELIHVRRYDNLVNLLQRLIESALFFHPMVWIISGWVRREREHCCDAAVIAHTRQPEAYAQLLVTLAEQMSRSSSIAPTVASSMAQPSLVGRIRRILRKEDQAMQVSRKTFVMMFASILILASVIGRFTVLIYAEEKLSSNKTFAADHAIADKVAAVIAYAGRVTDRGSGKSIGGATVFVTQIAIGSNGEFVKIAESKYQTDATGHYTFSIPKEGVLGKHCYISVAAEHFGYVRWGGFGFDLNSRNQKFIVQPSYEHIIMEPAETVSGTIVTPAGRPASGVLVEVESSSDQAHFGFDEAITDEKGRFTAKAIKNAETVLWIMPKDYAPSTQIVSSNRGDLGRFVLDKGLILKGRVVNIDGKPLPNVWVNSHIHGGPAKKSCPMGIVDLLARSALSDDKGEFVMAPLPAGSYFVGASGWPIDILMDKALKNTDRSRYALPDSFVDRNVNLDEHESIKSVEVHAVPHVVVQGQLVDSAGKPVSSLSGPQVRQWSDEKPGEKTDEGLASWSTVNTAMDKQGRFAAIVPKAAGTNSQLKLRWEADYVYRTRLFKDGAWHRGNDAKMGQLNHDMTDITVIRYKSPLVLLNVIAQDGKPITNYEVTANYVSLREADKQVFISDGDDISESRQDDNRSRISSLLPDEEFTVTVSAPGYDAQSEKLKLPEGVVKELVVKLKAVAAKPVDSSGKTTEAGPASEVKPALAQARLPTN